MPSSGSPDAYSRPHGASPPDTGPGADPGTGSQKSTSENAELQVLSDLIGRNCVPGGSLSPGAVLRSVIAVLAAELDASSALLVLRGRGSAAPLDPIVRIGRYETHLRDPIPPVDSLVGLSMRTDGFVRSGELSRDERAAEAERDLGAGPTCVRPVKRGGAVVGAVALARDRGAAGYTGEEEEAIARFEPMLDLVLQILGVEAPDEEDDEPSLADRKLMNTLRHEINNPLAVVMGQAQILKSDPGVDADPHLKQSIEAIFEGSQRIRDVLRTLTAPGESERRQGDANRVDPSGEHA